jgi:hypothetical protein
METKITDFYTGSVKHFTGPKPIRCPHCGAFLEATIDKVINTTFKNNHTMFFVTFIGTCCSKHFFGLYYEIGADIAKLLHIYPSEKIDTLPECINTISPRFIELYNQAFFAEQNSFPELAGSGYRNALEVLIKDYAINELSKPSEEVCKKRLNDAIGEYIPNLHIANSADVVRVLGNDFTHYERKYKDIDLSILKRYLHIFIQNIENEYLLAHPIVPTNR